MPDNQFVWAIKNEPPSLDPAVGDDDGVRLIIVQAYEALVRSEGSPPTPVPNLAESITSPDGQVYTVKLRPGIKFHDGSDLNADAVVFSMDRVLQMGTNAGAPFVGLLTPGTTKALDDLTVQFTLDKPSVVFKAALAAFFIVNPAVIRAHTVAQGPYGKNGDYGEQYLQSHDAGSGPYEIISRTPNESIELQAFSDYRGGWKANQYGRISVRINPEPGTVSLLMGQGDVDGAYASYPLDLFNNLRNEPNVEVYTSFGFVPYYLMINNQRTPTDNLLVRQAIAYSFDYKAAVQDILGGGQILPGPLPEGMAGALATPTYEYDLDKARALLKEAGIKPGTLTIGYATIGGEGSTQGKFGLLLQAGLAQIGVKLDIAMETWPDIITQAAKPETTFNVFTFHIGVPYADPDAVLFQAFHSSQHGTVNGAAWYTNPEVDRLLEQARQETNADKRAAMYQQVQEQIVADSPIVFVANAPINVALSKSVGGYNFVTNQFNYQVYGYFKQAAG